MVLGIVPIKQKEKKHFIKNVYKKNNKKIQTYIFSIYNRSVLGNFQVNVISRGERNEKNNKSNVKKFNKKKKKLNFVRNKKNKGNIKNIYIY